MATSAYSRWVAAGRPYRLARPIEQLKTQAARAKVPWLGDLGNNAHLTANRPEDHTPFSATAWPVPLPDYVVCAIDLGNGVWADRLLADARAGMVPWLKYLNFGGHHYNVKRGWDQESSSDQHLHISIRSDQTYTNIAPYNPFIAKPLIGVDMFVVEKRTPTGSGWYVTDGLRYRSLLTWDEVLILRDVTGRPNDVVVTSDQELALLCGTLDAAEGAVAALSDEQVLNLGSAIATAFDATEIREVLTDVLSGVRLTPTPTPSPPKALSPAPTAPDA